MKRGLRTLIAGLSLLGAAVAQAIELTTDVKGFIDEMVSKHQFDRAELTDLLEEARFRQDIIDLITRPAEAKPWYQYRRIFLTPARAEGGVAFWRARQKDQEGRRRMAVNLRLAEPEAVAHIPIDHFDGLNTFKDLPRDGRCVADYWF